MWKDLPEKQKQEYKRMILAFASLTEMFAQKAENGENNTAISPIINSKYQETIFQRVFHATAEDIGNTSYDASIKIATKDGNEKKYLIGIKTFGIASGSQKIAQFKANHDEWSSIINQMRSNASNSDGSAKTKDEINTVNATLYLELAKKIALLRNARIKSSESKIQGFSINKDHDNIESVYHVLMPSKKGDSPVIYVGETSYNLIDIDKIIIKGCTSPKNPTNFDFSDGNHRYRFTSADSQLLMDFDNFNIIQENWDVVYADDAYSLFANLANQIYGDTSPKMTESYAWMITNANGEVESFSKDDKIIIKTKEGNDIIADGVFIYIGQIPNANFLSSLNILDDKGYIKTDNNLMTSIDGVYAVGDALNKYDYQIVIAMGEAARVALEISRR